MLGGMGEDLGPGIEDGLGKTGFLEGKSMIWLIWLIYVDISSYRILYTSLLNGELLSSG